MQKFKKPVFIKISKNAKKVMLICTFGAFLTAVLPFLIVKGWSASYVKWEQRTGLSAYANLSYGDEADYVSVADNGEVLYLPIFDYICGVVAAEMPAS